MHFDDNIEYCQSLYNSYSVINIITILIVKMNLFNFSLFKIHKFHSNFLVPPLQLFRGTALSITASISSKCVESHELGDFYLLNRFFIPHTCSVKY